MIDRKARSLQPLDHERGDFTIIFNQEQSHGVSLTLSI
jgi:hypothetical protein